MLWDVFWLDEDGFGFENIFIHLFDGFEEDHFIGVIFIFQGLDKLVDLFLRYTFMLIPFLIVSYSSLHNDYIGINIT